MASSARKKTAVTRKRTTAGRKATPRKARVRMLIDDVTAILLISPDAKELCEFYKATLGLPLEDEAHDGMPLHYGYSLGDVHFASTLQTAVGREFQIAIPRARSSPSALQT